MVNIELTFRHSFYPYFSAPFKYLSIEQVINNQDQGNLLFNAATVCMHTGSSATCGRRPQISRQPATVAVDVKNAESKTGCPVGAF